MAVAVVVPWRPGDEHRVAAWRWVKHRYETEHPDWQLIEGVHTEGPWVKALAVATGIHQTDADTLVIADADVWCDSLREAVEHVTETTWAVPHGLVHRLDEQSTTAVLAGGPLEGMFAQRPYRGHAGGGIVCLHRTHWTQAPLDPRFQGWGQEDDAWALALTALIGWPWRGKAPLWHLWHPPQPRRSRTTGTTAGMHLYRRYAAVRRKPEAMRALIEEVTHGEPQARPAGHQEDPQVA